VDAASAGAVTVRVLPEISLRLVRVVKKGGQLVVAPAEGPVRVLLLVPWRVGQTVTGGVRDRHIVAEQPIGLRKHLAVEGTGVELRRRHGRHEQV